MADRKISEMPIGTVPEGDDTVVPAVQDGANVRVHPMMMDPVLRRAMNLRGWRTALSTVKLASGASSTARVLSFGDSYVRFVGSSFVDRVVERMSALYSVEANPRPMWRPVKGIGGWSNNAAGATGTEHGLTRNQGAVLSSGNVVEHVANCRQMVLAWTAQEADGATIRVLWDGVEVDEFTTTDAGVDGMESGRLVTTPLSAFGSHTLRVECSGAGTGLVDGCQIRTAAHHIDHWNGGVPGNDTSDYLPGGRAERAVNYVSTVQPDLIFLCLGTNDWNGGGSGPLGEFADNYRAVIDSVLGAVTTSRMPSLMLYVPTQFGATRVTWPDWVAAIYDIAAEYGAEVLDAYHALGGQLAAPYIAVDNIHLSNPGESVLADLMTDQMSAGLPPQHLASTTTARSFRGITNSGALTQTADATFSGPNGVRVTGTEGAINIVGTTGASTPGILLYASTTDFVPIMYLIKSGIGLSGAPAFPADTELIRTAAGVWSLQGGKITDSAAPTDDDDLATKAYVDT